MYKDFDKFLKDNCYLSDKNLRKHVNDFQGCLTNGIYKDRQLEVIPILTGRGKLIRASYLIKPPEQRGKIIKAKLKEYGLKGKEIG